MRLSTTRARLNHMIRACDNQPLVVAELQRAVGRPHDGSTVLIEDAPYIALVFARQAMIDECYTSRNTMRRGLSKSHFLALKDVTTATNVYARHPALRGVGMVGHHTEILHVWEACSPLDGRVFNPFPDPLERFVVLRPVWHIDELNAGMKITLWSADGPAPSDDRLADVQLHYRLLVGVGEEPVLAE